jgi:hypothetical protein
VHVSKQVLANSMYFHASFMLPSQELLAGPVECIDCFVAKGHWEEAPQGPLPHTPSRAVESLPWDLGGLQRADISAQVYALQAKVAAMLFIASPPPRLEDADAAGFSTVPAGPWAGGAGQCPVTCMHSGPRPQAGRVLEVLCWPAPSQAAGAW